MPSYNVAYKKLQDGVNTVSTKPTRCYKYENIKLRGRDCNPRKEAYEAQAQTAKGHCYCEAQTCGVGSDADPTAH